MIAFMMISFVSREDALSHRFAWTALRPLLSNRNGDGRSREADCSRQHGRRRKQYRDFDRRLRGGPRVRGEADMVKRGAIAPDWILKLFDEIETLEFGTAFERFTAETAMIRTMVSVATR
jgi:hypothetical protein